MSATGLGLRVRASMPGSLTYSPTLAGVLAVDYLLGIQPAPVYDIAYRWLRRPLRMRQDWPINDFRATRTGGSEVRVTNFDSVEEHIASPGRVTLDTTVSQDPHSIGVWTTTYYADPRDRIPQLTIDLLAPALTDADRQMLLAREIGDRVLVSDAPATWPAGTDRGVIEGIRHQTDKERHLLIFNTSQPIGAEPGEVGPWWQLDVTSLGDADAPLAF